MTFEEYKKKKKIDLYIDVLDLTQQKLDDLYGIEEFINLKTLDIGGNNISDIEPLKYLINLEDLWLNNNPITDISMLKELNKLRNLSLWDIPIIDKDLDVLLEIKNMNGLWLTGTKISKKYYTHSKKQVWFSDNKLLNLKNIIKFERRKRLIKLLDK